MISVCLTVYEGELYLEEQLLSILIQLDKSDELIISDDSLTSKSKEIIKKINDKRIILIDGPKKGVVKNFENALKIASGDLIFLSDQDDVWLPNKVELCMNALSSHDLVLTNAIVTDENLNHHRELYEAHPPLDNFLKILLKNKYVGSCMAFKKDILSYVYPFPKYIPMHDWWIGLAVMIKGSVYYENKPLMLYRRHLNTITNTGEQSQVSFIKKLFYRLAMLYALCTLLVNSRYK